MSDESAMDAVYGLVGTGVATQETVPTAFAIIGSRAGRGTRDGPTWRPRG
jgi:ADP-ribosylglycohydrolase